MSSSRRLAESEYETWDFHIDNWDHHYLFGTNKIKGRDAYCDESRHFTLYCTVTYSDHKKENVAQLCFMPNRNMDALLTDDGSYDNPPAAVGSLSTRKNNMSAYVNSL